MIQSTCKEVICLLSAYMYNRQHFGLCDVHFLKLCGLIHLLGGANQRYCHAGLNNSGKQLHPMLAYYTLFETTASGSRQHLSSVLDFQVKTPILLLSALVFFPSYLILVLPSAVVTNLKSLPLNSVWIIEIVLRSGSLLRSTPLDFQNRPPTSAFVSKKQ